MSDKLPVLLQAERAECGLACVAMILSYYGHKVSVLDLRRQFIVSANGLTLADLIDLSHRLKLNARSFKVELSALRDLRLPCILHWGMNHYVVLKKIGRQSVEIHDPARGLVKVAWDEVDRQFTGVALELLPEADFETRPIRPKFRLSDLWQSISGAGSSFGKIVLLSLVLQCFVLLAPYYLQTTIDKVLPSRDDSLMLLLAGGFIVILLFQQLVTILRSYIVMYLGAAFGQQVAGSLFRHLLHLPLSFFQKRDIGDIVTRFESLNRIREFLTNSFIEVLVDGFMMLTVLALLFYYDVTVTCVVLLFVLLYTLLRFGFFPHFRRVTEAEAVNRGRERSSFIENVQNIQTIMQFDAQPQRCTQWNNLYADTVNSALSIQKSRLLFNVSNNLLFGLENVLVIYLLAMSILDATITIGMLTAYLAYKQTFVRSFSTFLDKFMEFRMLDLHLERVSEIALTEAVQDNSIPDQRKLSGAIELQGLSLRFDDFTAPVFRQLDLKIEAGDIIAITGPSGSGKSSLARLLLGLIQPTEGRILVDNCPLDKFGHRNYRRFVAAVMQDDKLYAGSILDNICLFDPVPDIAFAQECARKAQVEHLILAKPMGYNSLISQDGSSLSGGEKQRLFLARALYKRPVILLMDEASSHLDVKTEMAINQAISELKMTRIIIAHRPQTIRLANRVYRLTRQGLMELGAHETARTTG